MRQSAYQEEKVESFYEDISRAIFKIPVHFTMIVTDFNANLGRK